MASFEVAWDKKRALLTTRIRSPITVAEAARYKEVLTDRMAAIPSGTEFVWLSSAVGYEALSDRAAHEELRSVVPMTLAAYGFRTSLLDLYEGAEIPVTRTRDIACRAVAHVHHDADKMSAYDEQLGRPTERYFTDEGLALSWLASALPSSHPCTILLIGGSLRRGSVNAAVLRTALSIGTPPLVLKPYERLGDLPHFNPDDDREPLPEAVADLRAQLMACDAVLISTPEYAGALPGSFKNLLDWTVGGGIQEKSVGWINASMGGAQGTYEQLRTVLTYTNTDIVAAACVAIPVPRSTISSAGIVMDDVIRSGIAKVLKALGARVAERRSAASGEMPG